MTITEDAVRKAIKATEYKYFGDYEMSDDQRAAVDYLVAVAEAYLARLSSPTPDDLYEGD